MAAPNPNPALITDAIWRFWLGFDALEPSALLGGVYAAKPGYHSYRNRLPSSDYSTGRDVAADKRGPGDKASAIDLTMSSAAMIKYTRRLDAAARARDPRLYTPAGPVLREFIGTKDGRSVYCYVLTGGRPLGVGADAGPDPGRDESHVWHLHLSFIRAFCANSAALAGVLSVLTGESLAAWRAKQTQGDDMALTAEERAKLNAIHTDLRKILTGNLGDDNAVMWWIRSMANRDDALVRQTYPNWPAMAGPGLAQLGAQLAALRADVAALAGRDFTNEEAIVAGVLAGLNPPAIAEAVVAALPAEQAKQVADELAARLAA